MPGTQQIDIDTCLAAHVAATHAGRSVRHTEVREHDTGIAEIVVRGVFAVGDDGCQPRSAGSPESVPGILEGKAGTGGQALASTPVAARVYIGGQSECRTFAWPGVR